MHACSFSSDSNVTYYSSRHPPHVPCFLLSQEPSVQSDHSMSRAHRTFARLAWLLATPFDACISSAWLERAALNTGRVPPNDTDTNTPSCLHLFRRSNSPKGALSILDISALPGEARRGRSRSFPLPMSPSSPLCQLCEWWKWKWERTGGPILMWGTCGWIISRLENKAKLFPNCSKVQ